MVSNNNEMKQHLIVGEKYLQVYSAGGGSGPSQLLSGAATCFSVRWTETSCYLMVCIYVASVVGVAVMGTSIHMETQNIILHFKPPV